MKISVVAGSSWRWASARCLATSRIGSVTFGQASRWHAWPAPALQGAPEMPKLRLIEEIARAPRVAPVAV
jgi:hypothetical protein